MTDKEKIRAEIERRIEELQPCNTRENLRAHGAIAGYYQILSFINSMQEEPVSMWHNASEEPNDMSHCLIFYGKKDDIDHYLHYEPVIYNKKEKMFVTASFPHPTGYKVEQKSIDGGCVAEVYKNKRDRISILDITQWCYLKDLHNLSNVERTVKNRKVPVSEDLEEAADSYIKTHGEILGFGRQTFKAGAKWQKTKDESCSKDLGEYINELSKQFPEVSFAKLSRIAVRVAKWQEKQDQSTIELAEDHAMLAGMEKMREQMMAKAVDGDITFDYYGDDDKTYGCIAHDSFCLEDFGLKDRDKVKVIVIKDD